MEFADRDLIDSLVNEAEALVVGEIHRQIPRHPELCTCQECVLDVAAHALNKVRPRYRVSLLDTVFADRREHNAYAREIERAVAAAIQAVAANPPHD